MFIKTTLKTQVSDNLFQQQHNVEMLQSTLQRENLILPVNISSAFTLLSVNFLFIK